MITALYKAFNQSLTDPVLRYIIFKGILGAFLIFVALWFLAAFMITGIWWSDLPIIGPVLSWLAEIEWLAAWLGGLSIFAFGSIMAFVTFILFPPVMTIIVGIFLDDVCEAVENKHYPRQGSPQQQTLPNSIYNAIKFLGITLGVNILALPIYLLTWWFFGLGIIVYYLVNGYLIGREYFELVAFRRMDSAAAAGLRRAHRGQVMLAGFVTVFAMTIPFINLVAPVLAAAMMVHIFMRLPRRAEFSERRQKPEAASSSQR